jgi:YD repeat-containing protein
MKTSVCTYILLVLGYCSFSQSSADKQIIPPSPNAAAIAKFGNTPVSYYTGLVNIDVPIYTIEIRDIKIPISLSYHAGGIKVSEESSRVGLGWALSCGGQITRTVINEDDFHAHPNAYLNPGNISPVLPTGPEFVKERVMEAGSNVLFYRVDKVGLIPVEFRLGDYIYGSNFDYEPDQFSYSFAGNSGKFIMGRDRMPVFEKQVKISFEPTPAGDSWLVRTADGFQYEFASSEYYTDPQTSGSHRISAWYLTKIRSLQGEEVTFEYTSLHEQFIKPVGSWQQRKAAMSISCAEFACHAFSPVDGPLPRKTYSNIYLARVTWKHGKIEFETDAREDLEGDIRIKSIKVFRKRYPQRDFTLLYEFRLDQSYFDHFVDTPGFQTADVTADRLRKRLKLNAISKYSSIPGSDPEWGYRFSYYEDQPEHRLPAKNSFSRDHWGFYNGKFNTSLIPSHHTPTDPKSPQDLIGFFGNERDPSPEHTKAYSLRSIRYPTGGTTTFTYEPHDYEIETTSANTNAFSRYKQFNYDCIARAGELYADVLDLTDEYVSVTGGTKPVEINAIFRSDKDCELVRSITNVYFEFVRESDLTLYAQITTGWQKCDSPDQNSCIYCGPGSAGLNYKGSLTLPPGRYLWRAFVPGGEDRFQNISASIMWWASGPAPSDTQVPGVAFAGGLRIAHLADHDPVVGRTRTRKFLYRYITDANDDGIKEEHSYGKLMSSPQYAFFDISWERKVAEGNGQPMYCMDCLNLVLQSDSHIPASGSQGYAVGYSKVIEINGSVEEGGYTEYEYYNEKDIPIVPSYPHHNAAYPVRAGALPTIASARNGLLKQLTHYRSDSIPVRRVVNEYDLKFSKTIYGMEVRRISATPFGQFDLGQAYRELGLPDADLLTLVYPAISSSLIVPKLSTEIYFDSLGNETLSKSSKSFYDNPLHLQRTRSSVTTSDNRTESTHHRYAEDYNTQTHNMIADLKATYQHSAPLEVTVLDESTDSKLILARATTAYSNFGVRLLPKEVYELNVPSPLNSISVPIYQPGQEFDAAVDRLTNSLHYSNSGNVLQISGEGQTRVGYLWGYDDALPITEVKNASNLAYTSAGRDSSTATIGITMGTNSSTVSQSFNFTSDYKGTVYLKLGVPGTPDYSTTLQYSGFRSGTVTLGHGACGITVIPFTGIPAGTHTITITLTNTSESVGACGEIVVPRFREITIHNGVTEFFLETFEDNPVSTENAERAHTGRRYRSGDYVTSFKIPNSRRYRIEYWYSDDSGDWQHKISPYVGPVNLTDGNAIDNVRIYPDDAHMKSYTYDPLIGLTSVIDEAGKATIYNYDEFGRLAVIRDGAKNIEQSFEYIYRKN